MPNPIQRRILGSRRTRLPDIFKENFNTGVASASWATDAGAPVYNFTPAIEGPFSLNLVQSANNHANLSASFSEVFVFFKINISVNQTGVLLRLYETTFATSALNLTVDNTGTVFITDTSSTHSATLGALAPAATVYNFWVHYKAGSGANAISTAAFSTGLQEPTSGANFGSIASANGTVSIQKVILNGATGGAANRVFDKLGVASFDMPKGW